MDAGSIRSLFVDAGAQLAPLMEASFAWIVGLSAATFIVSLLRRPVA